MKKFVNEELGDILKPKTPEQIDQALGDLTGAELRRYATKLRVPHLMQKAADSANANQLFTMGINTNNTELLKRGLKNGATNVAIGNDEAITIAVNNNDVELLKMLMKHPDVNPSHGGRRDQVYGNYENAPIRIAAQKGFIEIAKILLKDKRVDPTVSNNFPLRHAIENNHFDIVELLLNDERVINSLSGKDSKKIINKLIAKINES